MTDIYVVDARKPGKNTSDSRIPFQRFYLVPHVVSFQQMQRLTPYAIITRLTDAYKDILEERGLSFDSVQDHWVMVPIHMTQDTAQKDLLYPSYISNEHWRRATNRLPEFFPDDVTLLTPEGYVTPMCLACDKHLEHLAGECVIGSYVCSESVRVRFKPLPELVQLSLSSGVSDATKVSHS